MASSKTYTPPAPTALTLSRDDLTWKAEWKNSYASGNKEYTAIKVKWKLFWVRASDGTAGGDKNEVERELEPSSTSETHYITEFEKGSSKKAGKFKLTDVYPKGEHKITSAAACVRAIHKVPKEKKYKEFKGKSFYKDSGWVKLNVYAPPTPTVEWEWDPENATATVTVTSTEDDLHPWTQTQVEVVIKQQNGVNKTLTSKTAVKQAEWSKEYDVSSYITSLQAGKSVTLTCNAYAQGMAGDSGKYTSDGKHQLTIAMPSAATIGSITCADKKLGGRINVEVKSVGANTKHVQLERRHGEDEWEEVDGATDNKDCKNLYDSYDEADPKPGERLYYRIKSTSDNFVVHGSPVEAEALFIEAPKFTCMASCAIWKVEKARDGESAEVVMAFDDGTDNDGTELSWSEDTRAWDSTVPPETADFPGKDGTPATSQYGATKTATLSGLTPGKQYFIRCRRYKEGDSSDTAYSEYSEQFSLTCESAEDDTCAVISAEPDDDGKGATLLIGIDEDNANTGTEVAWSSYENAWTSNSQPSTLEADWAAQAATGAWSKTQQVNLRELSPGTVYYVRTRRYLEDSGGNKTYGQWSTSFSFTTKSKSEANANLLCGIVGQPVAGDDGTTATVVVGWNFSRTGCEVSWSSNPNAWESSETPETFEFEWADPESKDPEHWGNTATVQIAKLEDGVTHYVRARSYYEQDEKMYSAYSETVTVTPFSAPTSVVLNEPGPVRRGDPIEVYWTIEGEHEQAEFNVFQTGMGGTSLASGTGSSCHATITPDRYGSADTISFHVEAGFGGGMTASNTVSVAIIDTPSCEVCVQEVTAQEQPFEVYCDDGRSDVLLACSSMGIAYDGPDGDMSQQAGYVVWTTAMRPDWSMRTWRNTMLYSKLAADVSAALAAKNAAEAARDALDPSDAGYEDAVIEAENAGVAYSAALAAQAVHPASGTVYMASIAMPEDVAFLDTGSYSMTARAKEPVAGMTSDEASCTFKVNWAHQAPTPSDAITVEADAQEMTAAITLPAPTGAAQGDVYDVYRANPTGHELIAGGVQFGSTVTDRLAPFGDGYLHYRVACRTADGDVAFLDYEYELPAHFVRIDWEDRYIDLPYNLELSDSYEKAFEARSHMDGTVNGYYERAVMHTGGYSAEIPRAIGTNDMNLLRELGEYAGPVFCRTQHGMAFQCDAQVSELSLDNVSAAISARLDLTAMRLDSRYTVPTDDIEVPA